MNHANKILMQLRSVIRQKSNYPIGVLAYFGPDDKTITKVVAIVLRSPNTEPILRSWNGPEVSKSRETASRIGKFFRRYNATDVVMTESVVGCPHEEGVDFPAGEPCPYCPYWEEKTN